MSYEKSHLTEQQHGYDMVTAVTQASLNGTMMEWLEGYQGELFTMAFIYDKKTDKAVETDYDALVERVGFDPFSIPNDISLDDPRIKTLDDEDFMFAFQIKIGLPDFPPSELPPTLVLDKPGSEVTYNMVCETFKAIELQIARTNKWINLDQLTEDAPWQVEFTVDLDLSEDTGDNPFKRLPQEIQDEIKNLGEELFSIQQLYLDLNTAALSTFPSIPGLDPGTRAYSYLTRIFLDTYVKKVAEDGGVLLGFGVTSREPFPEHVSLIPTDLNFMVNAYKDTNGQDTADFTAYTLNYLIMTNNKSMPRPQPFSWNWIDKDNLNTLAGTVSINRNTFAEFLNKLLSPSLFDITKMPRVACTVDCNIVFNIMDVRLNFDPLYNEPKYNIEPAGGAHILSYESTENARAYDDCGELEYLFEARYTVNSDIYLENNEIKNVTKIIIHPRVKGDTFIDEEGDWGSFSLTSFYTIAVNAQGRLSVESRQGEIQDFSEDPGPDFWDLVFSLGTIERVVNDLRNDARDYIRSNLHDRTAEISHMLNGSNTWVFPGAKTFVFQDARFSEKQDMIAHILYADPNK